MEKKYRMVPEPRKVVYKEGSYQLKKPLTDRFRQEIVSAWHDFPHTAEKTLQENGVKIRFFEVANTAADAYSIKVTENGVLVSAGGYEGLCYAFQTFLKILSETRDKIRCLEIEDAPDCEVRAFHIDLSVYNYKIEYLRNLLDKLAELKYNAVLLDYRGMFPYSLPYATNFYGYKTDQVSRMVAYAKGLGITVIPVLPVLRDVDFIWNLEPYIWLSDLPEVKNERLAKVRAEVKEARELMKGLCRDLARAHSGNYVFLDLAGREEDNSFTQELTSSQEEYVLELCETLKEEGKLPLVWSDILMNGLLDKWPKGGAVLMRNNVEGDSAKRFEAAGMKVWSTYYALSFPATEVSIRLKSHLQSLLAIKQDKNSSGSVILAYSSHLSRNLDTSLAPQLMQGAMRMPIVLAWEAVYRAAALLWNKSSSEEWLKESWPVFYFGTDNEDVREFSSNMENFHLSDSDDYPKATKELMKMAEGLKPHIQRDMLDLVYFYARYRLFNRYIDQQFSRRREIMHVDKVIASTKEMHKLWQAAMHDKLPLETVSLMQRYLFGYVEELVRRAVKR
ncbi:hypothetical protein IKZ80_01340 [bacterium]|nr:hypothetical protein [bacterium]